ncbi:hypothetical protein ACFQPF_05125 [Fictibacillus iocasae]|uniref:Uncharacterized protein n=1 Tax=Fictibacillus iocasae TaxID=2715437 RepID=A0ABW2NNH3_9BACL
MERYMNYARLVIYLIAAAVIGLQQVLSNHQMIAINKVLFVAAMAVIAPIIVYGLKILRPEMSKAMKRESYSSQTLYRLRYVMAAVMLAMFGASLYVFYLTYEVVF